MMKALFVLSVCFLGYSNLTLAGYDISIKSSEISLKTKDLEIIKNAKFNFQVFFEHKNIPCRSDGMPIGVSCWRAEFANSGSFTTGVSGVFHFPAQVYHSNSLLDREVLNPLSIGLWGVYTPFTAADGKDYNCIAIQPYTLQAANINFSSAPDFMIDLTKEELQVFVNEKVALCKANIDSGRSTGSPYVLPY